MSQERSPPESLLNRQIKGTNPLTYDSYSSCPTSEIGWDVIKIIQGWHPELIDQAHAPG